MKYARRGNEGSIYGRGFNSRRLHSQDVVKNKDGRHMFPGFRSRIRKGGRFVFAIFW